MFFFTFTSKDSPRKFRCYWYSGIRTVLIRYYRTNKINMYFFLTLMKIPETWIETGWCLYRYTVSDVKNSRFYKIKISKWFIIYLHEDGKLNLVIIPLVYKDKMATLTKPSYVRMWQVWLMCGTPLSRVAFVKTLTFPSFRPFGERRPFWDEPAASGPALIPDLWAHPVQNVV